MKWKKMQVLIATGVLVASSVGVAGAQTTTERQRQRMQAAEARAQAAQHELQQALQLLAQAEDDEEARERLDDAIRELERARARLGRDRMISSWSTPNIYVSGSRHGGPQMGVYLNMENRPATDSIGVVLNSVTEDGPAYEAGLRDGDIITMANGEPLAREGRRGTSPANKLIQIKDDLEEGDTLHVEYRRGATTHSADIEVRYLNDFAFTLGNYGRALEFAKPEISVLGGDRGFNVATVFAGELSRLGILDVELIELDEELGWYFGVQEGLLVVRAPTDDEVLDLRSGDVIVSIDGREPTSQSQLMRILRSYEEGETMEISIMRQREPMTIEVTVPERDSDYLWRRNGRF
jgi:C-terminal processing protease CtpA/Prc